MAGCLITVQTYGVTMLFFALFIIGTPLLILASGQD
jgi:hypothetical protein